MKMGPGRSQTLTKENLETVPKSIRGMQTLEVA